MTWCEDSPAIHLYCPAKAPVSFKRRLGSGLLHPVPEHESNIAC